MEAALAESGVTSVRAEDCYAAMADLVRQGPAAYEAIVVALSDLTPGEQEFFQLAGHRYRSSPIYVYGPACGEITVTWAVQAGARRGITPSDLRAVLSFEPVAVPAVRPVQREPAFAGAPAPTPEELGHTAEGVGRAGAEELPGDDITIRRDQAARLRRKPAAGVAADFQTPPLDENVGSLLTPEELRALLSEEAEPL